MVHSQLQFIRREVFANGLHRSKEAFSHFAFGQLLHGLKGSTIGCVPIFVIARSEKFVLNIGYV